MTNKKSGGTGCQRATEACELTHWVAIPTLLVSAYLLVGTTMIELLGIDPTVATIIDDVIVTVLSLVAIMRYDLFDVSFAHRHADDMRHMPVKGIIMYAVAFIVIWATAQATRVMMSGVSVPDTSPLVLVLTLAVAPVAEELLFRGVVMGAARTHMSDVGAMLLQAVVFAVLHGTGDRMYAMFALGIMLAFVFDRTGNIWACIAIHAAYNTLATFVNMDSMLSVLTPNAAIVYVVDCIVIVIAMKALQRHVDDE